jgi:hypothetical protein
MFIPKWIIGTVGVLIVATLAWTAALAMDRNPLPFPDRNYQVFTTPSPEAKSAVIDLFGLFGARPRFRADSENVERAIFWDGTIVNYSQPEMFQRVGEPAAAVGFVVRDPVASAMAAVRHLRDRGFQAAMIEGAEPGLPIVFVTTNALNGTALVFRPHVLRMGQRPAAWKSASDGPAPVPTASGPSAEDSATPYDEATLLARGYTRVTFPDPDPGIPAYARVTSVASQFYHDEGWLAIPFFRDPDCVPDDFDLLRLFDFPGPNGPGSFACPLRHSGHYLVEDGAQPGTFPRLYVSHGDNVPFWFVRWSDFQKAMARGSVTLPQVRAMNPRKGVATDFRETVHPRLDEHLVITDARGRLEDGTFFEFHVTHVGDQTREIRLRLGDSR